MSYVIVSSKELGTNCWLPNRFIKGSRCAQVMSCTYPEKKSCCAVQAEVDYLGQRIIEVQGSALKQIQALAEQAMSLLLEQEKGGIKHGTSKMGTGGSAQGDG